MPKQSQSLLSPMPPMDGGATTRGKGGASAGHDSNSAPKPHARPIGNGSMDQGERSHKHAMPGDRVHDQHIKMGAGGMTHIGHAVKSLERRRK